MTKFGRMNAQPPAHAPQKPPRMYEIQMPTWIASGTGQRLADGDAFPHLLPGEPFLFADHLALHLPDERDGTAESDKAEAQVVPDEIADRHAAVSLFRLHS